MDTQSTARERARRSTPASPAELHRDLGPIVATLNEQGLVIQTEEGADLAFTVEQALALSDLFRTAGARQLLNRAWLATQHEAVIDLARDEENRQKRHAGRAA